MRVIELLRRKSRILRKVRSIETVAEAAAKLARHDIGALLVYDLWGRFLGLFSERDIIRGLERNGSRLLERPVEEVMSGEIVSCQPQDRIGEALRVMTIHQLRHLPVEEQGDIVGIVSIGDVVRALLGERTQEVEVLRDLARLH